MDIVIDTTGQTDLLTKDQLIESDDDLELENSTADPLLFLDSSNFLADDEQPLKKKKINPSKDIDLDDFEKAMGWRRSAMAIRRKKSFKVKPDVSKVANEMSGVDKILKKSAIKPGFEQLEAVPPYDVQKKYLVKQRRKEREKTIGSKWYNLPAPEMTDEIKHDLEVIQMRSVLDPKHFYKKNDLKALPKYFQIGKVMDSPRDYYSDRLTKKERKKTIVDELMANAEFAKYNKRKYKEIIDEKKKRQYKAHKHARKLKGKKGK